MSSHGLSSTFLYSHASRINVSDLQHFFYLFRVSLTGKSDKTSRGHVTVFSVTSPWRPIALMSLAQQSTCYVVANAHNHSFFNKHTQLSFKIREANTSTEVFPNDV